MSLALRELDLRDYGNWPLLHRAATCLLLALLAFALPWLGLTRSVLAERQALSIAESGVQARLLHARQQLAAWPALRLDADQALPSLRPDIPAMLTAMAGTAQAAGLHGGQFRPASAPDAADKGIPIELRVHGRWPQLVRFARELTAPAWDGAIVGLREIGLRAQPQATTPGLEPVLELSASVWIHPRPAVHITQASGHLINTTLARNPFMGASARSPHPGARTVVGSLRSGTDELRLVLTADGELRRERAPAHQ